MALLKKYTIKINDIKIYSTSSDNKFTAFEDIKFNLPQLLPYPNFFCIICCPKKVPMSIIERLIFYSEPYKYYISHKHNKNKHLDIETDEGFYFHGESIIKHMKNINDLVLDSSDSESDNTDNSNLEDADAEKLKLKKNREKFRHSRRMYKKRTTGNIRVRLRFEIKQYDSYEFDNLSDSSDSDSDSDSDDNTYILKVEKLNLKYIIYYLKNYMTYKVFNSALEYKGINIIYDKMELITEDS